METKINLKRLIKLMLDEDMSKIKKLMLNKKVYIAGQEGMVGSSLRKLLIEKNLML